MNVILVLVDTFARRFLLNVIQHPEFISQRLPCRSAASIDPKTLNVTLTSVDECNHHMVTNFDVIAEVRRLTGYI
jgi:hypothetical protein